MNGVMSMEATMKAHWRNRRTQRRVGDEAVAEHRVRAGDIA